MFRTIQGMQHRIRCKRYRLLFIANESRDSVVDADVVDRPTVMISRMVSFVHSCSRREVRT